jgi:hypothetical protein
MWGPRFYEMAWKGVVQVPRVSDQGAVWIDGDVA